ncbi:MAG: sigma-70 family RNA polymerase sigma factor [SAR324 cluster bacterium]|nr:sigma-70 family RNA polymerase sigma factor [SAR324 cluster bacterium]
MDDKILIKAHLKGDKSAFEVLVKKHQASVGRLSYSIMKSDQGVSDIVQEVFLSVFRGLSKFRGDAAFKTWLYKITVHETMRYLKKRKRWNSLIDKDRSITDASEVSLFVFDHKTSPEHLVLDNQKKSLIHDAMKKLSDNHRIVLHLHYQEDLSVQEISEILEIPVGSVKSRLHYARIQLKELLSPFFESSSSHQGEQHVL